MALSKDDFSHLAAGPLARGWAVAMIGYTLAPQARIADITQKSRLPPMPSQSWAADRSALPGIQPADILWPA